MCVHSAAAETHLLCVVSHASSLPIVFACVSLPALHPFTINSAAGSHVKRPEDLTTRSCALVCCVFLTDLPGDECVDVIMMLNRWIELIFFFFCQSLRACCRMSLYAYFVLSELSPKALQQLDVRTDTKTSPSLLCRLFKRCDLWITCCTYRPQILAVVATSLLWIMICSWGSAISKFGVRYPSFADQ